MYHFYVILIILSILSPIIAYNKADILKNISITNEIFYTSLALLIITYAMLQLDKIDPKGFWYSFNNLIVAILVTVSLVYTMNIASMVIEVFWFLISVYGIVMYFKRKNES